MAFTFTFTILVSLADNAVAVVLETRRVVESTTSLEPTPSYVVSCLVHLEYDKVIVIKNNNTNDQINNHRTIYIHQNTFRIHPSQTKQAKDKRFFEQKRRHVPAERAQKIRVSDLGEFKLARIEPRKMAGRLPIAWTGLQFQSPNKKLILHSTQFSQIEQETINT